MAKNRKGKQKALPQTVEDENSDTILEHGESAMPDEWGGNGGGEDGDYPEDESATWVGNAALGGGGGDGGWTQDEAASEAEPGGWGDSANEAGPGWEQPANPVEDWSAPTNHSAPPRAPAANHPWPNLVQVAGIYPAIPPPSASSSPMQRQAPTLRHTSGLASWQNWGAEAAAQAKPLRGAANQTRVAFANTPTMIPSQSYMPSDRSGTLAGVVNSPRRDRAGPPPAPPLPPSKSGKKGGRAAQPQHHDPWGNQDGGQNGMWNDGGADVSGNGAAKSAQEQGWQQQEKDWQQQGKGLQQQEKGWQQQEKGQQQEKDWQQQDNSWDQENKGWEQTDDDGWEKRDGSESAAHGAHDGGWNDVGARQQYAESLAKTYVPRADDPSSFPMPSRTLAYAMDHSPEGLKRVRPAVQPHDSGMTDYAQRRFVESHGEGLEPASRALFGRERKARDRIHWGFPYDKDPRVRDTLHWIQDKSHGLGALGLEKFLQARERGALFVNASYTLSAGEPALDWLSYPQVVETRDKLIQESVGFYDPAKQVVVFTLLLSRTGNSTAMWRRKVTVPNNMQLAYAREIELAKAALMKDYPVYVDELACVIDLDGGAVRLTLLIQPSTFISSRSLTAKKEEEGFLQKIVQTIQNPVVVVATGLATAQSRVFHVDALVACDTIHRRVLAASGLSSALLSPMEPSGMIQRSATTFDSSRRAPPDNNHSTSPHVMRPETRAAIFAALILPVAFLPFFALRRQLINLHRKVDAMGATTVGLQKNLKTSLLELSVKKEEHAQMRGMLQETRQNLETTRGELHRLELARTVETGELRTRLNELAETNQQMRSHLSQLRDLGLSLADVAAFMQEVEIQQGFVNEKADGWGIDRLRRLALQFKTLDLTGTFTVEGKVGDAQVEGD
ncbi:hypothetical protein EW146_g1152 [Bondarzewia mesenterica]|uniref:CcmS related domain-containing protein n=1 Tax=Bondarzewia mesenterica TaxID=1095465 RepID=A0A4S4M4R3_9AGAM|nr:hypothetical protein EW146_g1152 [Bondarzewia mesenterica]